MSQQPIITLTTDFGISDHFVGTIKGVILNIVPEAQIVDICHSVQAFDVLDGALTIAQAYSYFPAGTVHLVVVDPGVGSARRPILATSEQQHFVAPDNGVLSLIYAREERIHVRHITAAHYYLQPVSNTFHARDIFAPVTAYLAKGVDPAKFGDEVSDFVRFNAPKPKPVDGHTLRGVVLKVDRFGNLITNITPQDAPRVFQGLALKMDRFGNLVSNATEEAPQTFATEPAPFRILVGKREITEVKTAYAEGAPGEVFGVLGSMGYLEIVINRGSAAQALGVGKGSEVSVILEGAAAVGNAQ